MSKIIAIGEYYGDEITVEVTQKDGEFIVSMYDYESSILKEHLLNCIKNQHAMGGTYFPDPNSLLAAYNVLNHNFFDKVIDIRVDGDIEEIPYEDNKIY